ncbi:hypothetical protein D3C76_1466150 [compost metagenome]
MRILTAEAEERVAPTCAGTRKTVPKVADNAVASKVEAKSAEYIPISSETEKRSILLQNVNSWADTTKTIEPAKAATIMRGSTP